MSKKNEEIEHSNMADSDNEYFSAEEHDNSDDEYVAIEETNNLFPQIHLQDESKQIDQENKIDKVELENHQDKQTRGKKENLKENNTLKDEDKLTDHHNFKNNDEKDYNDDDDDNDQDNDEIKGEIDEEEYRRSVEEKLSEEEKLKRKENAQILKDDGNKFFRESNYDEAIGKYSEALGLCPFVYIKERSIMYSNRAACHMKMENNNEAINDCNKAIELHPHYLKAVLRRAELYEKTEKLDEALADYQKALEIDPSQHKLKVTVMRLSDEIKVRNEKMKEEMMGKLKDLGNLVLKPFGLSTDNFQLQQNPDTGSYSVNFKQN